MPEASDIPSAFLREPVLLRAANLLAFSTLHSYVETNPPSFPSVPVWVGKEQLWVPHRSQQ